MKNEIITIYELIGLIKVSKAPKKIKYIDDELVYRTEPKDYYFLNRKEYLFYSYLEDTFMESLNDTVEILPEENEMKEMIYQADRKTEVLYHGFYKDYEFYIMNLGPHPTAYVNVFNNNLLAMKDYDDINIDVHRGLTYSEDFLCINDKSEKVKGWFIGWDYAHYDDFDGCEISMPEEIRINGNKWTTEEIYEDVKSVIEQCINYKENDEWEDICELLDDSRYNFSDRQNGMTQEDRRLLDSNFKTLGETINQLIKNQKRIIERLNEKDE